jgi:AraC-like DNA-binding protein
MRMSASHSGTRPLAGPHHEFQSYGSLQRAFRCLHIAVLKTASYGDFGFRRQLRSAWLKPKVKCFMSIKRASISQKAERLDRARNLLVKDAPPSEAVHRLAEDCSLSRRQAYRYVQQAKKLKDPVPAREGTIAFTVKIPHHLLQRVRAYAATKELTISEVVGRALLMQLPGETCPASGAPGHERKPIVLDHIEALAAIGCTLEDIAAVIGMSKRTLMRREKEELIGAAIKRGRAKAKMSLRRSQLNSAIRGNVTMQIFLGKQMLGQRDFDRPEDKSPNTASIKFVDTYPEGDPRAGKA